MKLIGMIYMHLHTHWSKTLWSSVLTCASKTVLTRLLNFFSGSEAQISTINPLTTASYSVDIL